uniref:Uncharacterized protein n=1 Tax=Peronospora matthiolae TaxID=2874970 RepID=A0AAV1U354_9STRA
MDADVDRIDTDDDDDDDDGIFSIANNCRSEDDDALATEENVLSAVHTKRTAIGKDESAKEFLLTREAVVRFIQDLLQMQLIDIKQMRTKMEEQMFFYSTKNN